MIRAAWWVVGLIRYFVRIRQPRFFQFSFSLFEDYRLFKCAITLAFISGEAGQVAVEPSLTRRYGM